MGKVKRVLVACEESQAVTIAFRERGHEAYSCDILPCSGGYPEWHIQDDVLNHLNDGWGMMIAFPDCTFITNSGVCWLHKDPTRWNKLRRATLFFSKLLHADIKYKALENPIPHKYAVAQIGRKYDQLIQPYQFGHMERKATCLWLDNLPSLVHTDNVKEEMDKLPKNVQQRIHYLPPSEDRAKLRSKTFEGIAKAMAQQWGNL